MRRRGFTIMQVLIGGLVSLVVVSALFYVLVGFSKVSSTADTMAGTQFDAEAMAQRLAADLRKASLCTSSDSGCTVDAALSGAGTSGVTVYVRNGGNLEQRAYSINNGNFQRAIGERTEVLQTNAALTLTYYRSSTYRTSSWTTFVSPPTDTEAKQVIAVGINATVTRNGVAITYTTTVRLRNSPKRATSFD